MLAGANSAVLDAVAGMKVKLDAMHRRAQKAEAALARPASAEVVARCAELEQQLEGMRLHKSSSSYG